MCALARAEDAVPGSNAILGWERLQAGDAIVLAASVHPSASRDQRAAPEHIAPPMVYGPGADDDAPGLAAVDRETGAMQVGPRRALLHIDDVTTATGFADSRIRTMALALDAVIPRAGGLTIQPRVQLAYQPGGTGGAAAQSPDMLGDSSATGVGVRLYGTQPTRLAGIYPFVEADWWQDSRKQTINFAGTKIDTDLLRGLFSFNIGAHGNTSTGMKLWFKVKAGHSPSGTVGARYRW